jgi:hypothetical protein
MSIISSSAGSPAFFTLRIIYSIKGFNSRIKDSPSDYLTKTSAMYNIAYSGEGNGADPRLQIYGGIYG